MRRWTVRIIAFVLIALGAMGAHAAVTRHFLARDGMEQHMMRDQARELETLGIMLADWWGGEEKAKVEAYLRTREESGQLVTLFNGRLARLAGPEPVPEVMARVRAALDKAGFDADPFPGPGPRPEVLSRALSFTGLDGAPYVVSHATLAQAMPPGPPLSEMLGGAGFGLGVALLLTLVLIPGIERPINELGKALKRLAHGDLAVRLDKSRRVGDGAYCKLADEFNATVESLASRQQEQRMMLCGLSHDMRSPLTRMALAVDMALARNNANSIRLLERLRNETEHLNSLVAQMVDLVKAEDEPRKPDLVDMAGLVRELVEECGFEASALGKRVTATAAVNGSVLGNREQLRSMLENVLRNAIRHAPEQTAVEVSMERLEHCGRNCLRVLVQDSGPGVPPSELSEIFKPFHRVEQTDGPQQGMGLGLAIARHVAHGHKGRIYAANMDRGGLAVTIELPAAEHAAARVPSPPPAERFAAAHSG